MAISQLYKLMLNACLVVAIGLGPQTKVIAGMKQRDIKVQMGRLGVHFDTSRPIYSNLSPNDPGSIFPEFTSHN